MHLNIKKNIVYSTTAELYKIHLNFVKQSNVNIKCKLRFKNGLDLESITFY